MDDEGHAAMEMVPAPGVEDADRVLAEFSSWPACVRVHFIQSMVHSLNNHDQVCLINELSPLLRRNLLESLPQELSWKVLFYLDTRSLCVVGQVSKAWNRIQTNSFFWHKLMDVKKLHLSDWKMLYRMRAPEFAPREDGAAIDWKRQFLSFHTELAQLSRNWGDPAFDPTETSIECNGNGIYCLQYDDEKIVTGSRDNLVKIWSISDRQCQKQLKGHGGSVLCLQFDEVKVISGSSDGTVRVWDLATGECLQTLEDHDQSVLHLKFLGDQLVTCSKDKTVMLWKRNAAGKYEKIRVMDDHKAAVNVVEFDTNYIVSASGDRSVRIWDTQSGVLVTTLKGHTRGIACLQFQGDTIVTGSSDQSLKKWSISEQECKITLIGHEELVRCVRFNESHIVSGSYDKTVRIWDFHTGEKLRTLQGHQNRVFRVQFDHFKIVSSSQDDQIKIWDFYDPDEYREGAGWGREVTPYTGNGIGEDQVAAMAIDGAGPAGGL